MRTAKDVEAYLGALSSSHGRSYAPVDDKPGTYLLRTRGETTVAIRVDAPLVVARVSITTLTPAQRMDAGLLRTLLAHNATTLVHTSFGLEGDQIVLSAALELANLDLNEFEAVVDELELTLAREVPSLQELFKKGS